MSSYSKASTSANVADDAKDPPTVALDDLLSKELLQLSVEDRNDLQEEIHGVRCLAPEETPRFLEDSLRKLAIEIDDVIPGPQKRAYLQSQDRPASAAFINDRDFRLRFLRCELFDYRKAAIRMVRVCDCLLKLFGRYALERHILLSDFTNEELKVIRKGRVQVLPFRDRSGRRIVILIPGAGSLKEKASIDQTKVRDLQVKIFLYVSYVLGRDVDTQRRGIVFLVWFDAMLESTIKHDVSRIREGVKSHQISFIRASALHICSPDTPSYRVIRGSMGLGYGSYVRKIRIHLGISVEIRYILNGYGISTDTIPVSWTGTVKVGYLKQWLRIRQYLEDPSMYKHKCDGCKFCSNNKNCKFLQPIECPRLNDVLFKKGKSAKNHPGNEHFRSLIQSKYEQTLCESSKLAFDFDHETINATPIKESLVAYFFEEVEKGNMRILMWNEKHSWWSILNDERLIRKKIENTVINSIETLYLRPRSLKEATTKQELSSSMPESNDCFFSVTNMLISHEVRENGIKRRRLIANSMSIPNDNPGDCGDSDDEKTLRARDVFGTNFRPRAAL